MSTQGTQSDCKLSHQKPGLSKEEMAPRGDRGETASVPKRKAQLIDLCPEILQNILDCLERRDGWMRSLLLTCRHLYQSVLPRLYHEMEWGVASCDPENHYKLLQMLDQDNVGLNHVRSLVLFNDDEYRTLGAKIGPYPDAASLIYRLPKNTLKSFCWVSWHPMPSQIYRTLLTRQRSLKSVELNCSDIPIDALVGLGQSSLLSSANNIERLRIMPGSNEPLPQVARQFLQEPHHIPELDLNLVHMAQDEGKDGRINGRYTSSGAVLALVSGLKPSTVRLQTLDLTGVNLRCSHRILMSILDIPSLQNLCVIKCKHAEDFLKAIGGAAQRSSMNLRKFELYHAQAYQSQDPSTATTTTKLDPLLAAVNMFLANVPPLRTIWICLRGFDRLPDVASIANHGSTLRWLFIDVRKAKGPLAVTYPLSEWETLCSSLKSIHQLDMTYPVARTDCQIEDYEDFCRHVSATASVPTLRTLGFNNWPYPFQDISPTHGIIYDFTDFNFTAYQQLLAFFAADVVKVRHLPLKDSGSSNLAVISFGICEGITNKSNWGFGFSDTVFVKSRIRVLGGEEKTKMELLSHELRCWDGPHVRNYHDIDVLAHDRGKFEVGTGDDE
ncbi:MAG: hypothetical protein Q9224_004905 [Gallowayella concinna]